MLSGEDPFDESTMLDEDDWERPSPVDLTSGEKAHV